MRFRSGEYKGRRLIAGPGKNTRPTSDKIKEAVFHMIGPYFSGGSCLDLYAGSGSLCIEALSRGMTRGHCNDKNGKAVQTIKDNIEALKIEDVTVTKMDAFRCMKHLKDNHETFDLILVDPPYQSSNYIKIIKQLLAHQLVNDQAIIYCEHDGNEELPNDIEHLQVIKRTNYSKAIG